MCLPLCTLSVLIAPGYFIQGVMSRSITLTLHELLILWGVGYKNLMVFVLVAQTWYLQLMSLNKRVRCRQVGTSYHQT